MAPIPRTPRDPPQDLLSEAAGAQDSGPPPLSPLVLPALASVSPLYHQLCVCLSISSPPWGALLPQSQTLQGSLTLLKVAGKGALNEGPFLSVCLPPHVSLFLPTLSLALSFSPSRSVSPFLHLSVSPSPFAPAPSLGTSVSLPSCPRLSLPTPRVPGFPCSCLCPSLPDPSAQPSFP